MPRPIRRVTRAALVLAGAFVLAVPAQPALATGTRAGAVQGHTRAHSVAVAGEVGRPASYTPAAVAALPQTTLPYATSRRPAGDVMGAALLDVVELSAPRLPAAKNPQLRVVVTVVAGHGRRVSLALGELDPGSGNHPALLVPAHGRVALIVPGDRTDRRTLGDVRRIDVAVTTAGSDATVPAGAVRITDGRHSVLIAADRLACLISRTVEVTFQAGTTSQAHVEQGPDLADVLALAGIRSGDATAVAAVGSDGYAATVTLAEAEVGGRTLLLSTVEDGVPLARPRLVPAGDVRGGRYVSDVTDLVVVRPRRP